MDGRGSAGADGGQTQEDEKIAARGREMKDGGR